MVKIFSGEFDVFRYLIFKNYNSSCVFNSFLYFWLIQQYFLVYIRFHNNIEWILFQTDIFSYSPFMFVRPIGI